MGAEGEKKHGRMTWIFLLGALGAAILLFGGLLGEEAERGGEEMTGEVSIPTDVAAYEQEVVERIENICSRVRGAGATTAVVTLRGGYRTVYAVNSQSGNNTYKNEFVLTGSGSSEQALAIGYEMPEIVGIGIVCRGGQNADVRQEIVSLVSAAFGVSSNKIFVTASE